MGLFWNMIQQNQISEQQEKSENLEDRVLRLEKELRETRILLNKTLHVLEKYLNVDIDGDNKIG